jgi:hypothetical protein
MDLTFLQSLHQPDTPSCERRTSFWHNNMLTFCSNKLLHWRCAFIYCWFLLFNGSLHQHIQIPLSHLILEWLQIYFEFSVPRLKIFVFPIKVLEIFVERKISSSCKHFQVKGIAVIIHELFHLDYFR